MQDISKYDPEVIKYYPLFDEEKGMFYRNIQSGNGLTTRDYEPIVETTYGKMPQSRLKSAIERNKIARAQQLAQLNNKVKPTGTCPIRGSGSGMTVFCNERCAWWNGTGCSILSAEGVKIEEKKTCPISAGPCDKNCVFGANNSCKLANGIKSIIEGEELSR